MFAECTGEPSTDWQRRWLIRRLIKFNKSTIDKLQYPAWYLENPQMYNSTRRPLPPSSTPDTYFHDPDYGCDPYHNPDLYDQTTLTFKETINVPFHEFAKKTNMNLDTTKRRIDDNNDHQPVPHADEQETELQVIVSPPEYPLKPIIKKLVSNSTTNRSPIRVPAPTNEIRASMTSSPSSPQSPEILTTKRTPPTEAIITGASDAHKAGDPPANTTTQTTVTPIQKTRRIKRALTCEFDNKAQLNTERNYEPENHQHNEDNTLLQLDPNLITSIPTSDKPAGEKCLPLFSAIALKQKRRMLFAPMDFKHFSIDALIDSGALVNCMPESEFQKLKNMSPDNILQETDPPPFKLQVANGDIESPTRTIQLQFEIGDWTFKETFIVANKITGPILGLTFLKSNSAILDASQGLLHFPHLTYAINPVSEEQPAKPYKVSIPNQTTLAPDQCITVEAAVNIRSIADTTGVIHPIPSYTEDKPIAIASSLSTAHEMKVPIRITNTSPTPFTIKKNTVVAEFHITTPKEAKNIKPLSTAALKVLTEDDSEQALEYVHELLKTTEKPETTQQFWFPTPDNPGDPSTHTPVQRRILREIEELEEIQKLNPTNSLQEKQKFLENFKWEDSQLGEQDRKDIEDILVEYHDIFARHRLDIGVNHEFKIKLTPKNDQPAYTQSLPCPVNLKEDLTVELALMHYYGIITTLPFSKYASPIFAQRKPNGRLRLLVDLRKINSLIADDYTNNNHPVSTLSDAAQHLAGKKLFCKLDCSQAYHVLQMADKKSVELLAFNFASRTFAYLRLAQGLSRSLSSFSSFMREYLDRVIKADKCAQYVDDIGIATHNAEELKTNLREVFQCVREAGLRLTMAKCQFGAKEVQFLGRTVSPEGIAPQDQKIHNYLQKLTFPKTKKGLQRYIGFVNYYRNYIPRLSEKIAPFHDLIKAEKPIKITNEIMNSFSSINKSLDNACGLWLKQPMPNRQYVLMTDANFKNAGYALMIEENEEEKITSVKKTYAPVAFGSKMFSPSQIKMSIYAKEFLAIYFAFMEYSHILWESTKPVVVLTDNKSVTRFFQTKIIPPALWNACDFVLQFRFTIAHVPGKMNTAADFLSRLDLHPKEKVHLTIRDDITTTPIQVNIQSSDVAEEEQFFFMPDDDTETEEQIWERKLRARKKFTAKDDSPPPSNETTIETTNSDQEVTIFQTEVLVTQTTPETTTEDDSPLKTMRHQQDKDNVLRNYKLRLLKEPYNEQLLASDPRAARYIAQDSRIILKDGLLYRQYFDNAGKAKFLQILLPEHLIDSFILAHHGQGNKHPGIAKVIQQCREKYYYPGMAARIAHHISRCTECMQTKRIDKRSITPPMIDTSKLALGPEDALQMDIVPFDEPSGGYHAIITAMDVFSRYLFTYNVVRTDASTVARVLVDIMTRHAYLPTTIITDKGTQFMSEVVADATRTLGIQLRHATTKHAQTIGILERCHASLKESLKISTGERRTMWHQYVAIATLNYNTSYHSSLGCEPSRVFHGRIPYNVLDLKFGIRNAQQTKPTTTHGEDILHKTQQIKETVNKNLMQSYIRYKQYYDKKANAHPLHVNEYCYALHPKANTQGTKIPFTEYLWTGPYIVVKTLPNNNYLIRKLQTKFTQILHRIRLKPCPTDKPLPDKPVLPKEFIPDKEVDVFHDDLYAQAWQSNSEDFTPTPNTPLQKEPTVTFPDPPEDQAITRNTRPPDPEDFHITPNPDEPPNDTLSGASSDNYVNDTPTQNSPRKNKYNLRANPPSNWKKDYAYYNPLNVNTSSQN